MVKYGSVRLERTQSTGAISRLQTATAGDIIAEASLYSDSYHCDAIANEASTIWQVDKGTVQRIFHEDPNLAELWAKHLAKTVQKTRILAEIRSLKTVAERLDSWVEAFGELNTGRETQSIASEIAVSREALYRELSKRRKLTTHG